MRKVCEDCRKPFEAKRSTGRFCSERCKKRAQRRPQPQRDASGTADVVALPQVAPVVGGSLTRSTVAELDSAGRLDSSAGQAALVLARRIDDAESETGAGLASLVREHRAALAEAVKGAAQAADPLDELRLRRERKFGAG